MKLATTLGPMKVFSKNGIPGTIEFMAQSKFRYIDYNFDGPERFKVYSNDNWSADLAETKEVADKHGMKFVQAHAWSYNPLTHNVPDEVGMMVLRRNIEACAYLGIPNIVVHAGTSDDYKITTPGDRVKYDAVTREFFLSLLPTLEKFNVTLLAENSCRCNQKEKVFWDRGYELAENIDKMNSKYIQAVWDTGHANLDNSNQYDDIMALGKRLKGIHVHDNYTGKDHHRPPFEGTMDADGLIQGLIDSGYEGYFTFEAGLFLWSRVYKEQIPGKFQHGNGSLAHPSPEMGLIELNMLYEIGKYMLSSYGIFEE